jgi:hypothetical protein
MMILLLAAVIKGDENTYHDQQERRCRMQCAAFYELRRGVEEAPALSRVKEVSSMMVAMESIIFIGFCVQEAPRLKGRETTHCPWLWQSL